MSSKDKDGARTAQELKKRHKGQKKILKNLKA
jgi:hypothetical protein